MFSILRRSRSHLLKPLSVESITAVDIDGTPYVANVVGNEGPAVKEKEGLPPRATFPRSQSLCKLVPRDGGQDHTDVEVGERRTTGPQQCFHASQ